MIADQDQPLTIQQAAEKTGLTIHTLRYYERIALLSPVARTPTGHRRYVRQDVERIIFLNNLRLTGMPLEQMKHYSTLLRQGDAGIPERLEMLAAHREEVARNIAELQQMLGVIDTKIGMLEDQIR